MKLKKDDHVVTAFAENASGPGWTNQPIWVVVRNRGGDLRMECIQPRDQTRDMILLYGPSQASHGAMTAAVRRKVEGK